MKTRSSSLMRLVLALILLVALPIAGAVGNAASGKGLFLSGLVTGDRGKAVAGAQVELYHYGTGLIATAVTGRTGFFTLTIPAVSEPLFWVRVWAKDHETLEQIWVPSGEVPSLHLRLSPLLGAVSGEVTGSDQTPIGGAQVELVREGSGIIAETTAGTDGRFRFARVPSGSRYQVRARLDGRVPAVASLGEVSASRESTVRLSLGVAGGQILGEVIDQVSGRLLSGATIAVEDTGLGAITSGATGSRGDFALTIPTRTGASYRLQVSAPGYAIVTTEPFTLGQEGVVRFYAGKHVKLTPQTATVTGRAMYDGEGLANQPIWLEQEGVGAVGTAQTDATGYFTLTDVAANGARYRARLVAKASTDRFGNVINLFAASTDWFVPEAGHTTNLGLTATNGKLHDHGEGMVRGLVTGKTGSPVAGATVELVRAGDKVASTVKTGTDGSYLFDKVKSNQPESNPFFPGLFGETGTGYVVRVTQEGYTTGLSGSLDVQRKKETLADVNLTPQKAKVTVRTVDSDGRAVEGAEVKLVPTRGTTLKTMSGAGGLAQFQLPTDDQYRVEVTKAGYRLSTLTDLKVTPGLEKALDLTLNQATVKLKGRVVGTDGTPVESAAVTARSGASTHSANTSADGYYQVEVPAGVTLLLSASNDDATAAATALLTGTPGSDLVADLTLRSTTGSVAGQLVNEEGQPLSGVMIELWRSGTGIVATAKTGEDGSYNFESVVADPVNRYAVRISLPGKAFRQVGYRTPPPLFLVQPGATEQMLLMLAPLR